MEHSPRITKASVDATELGLRIKNLRIDARKSQGQLSYECRLTSKNIVSMWECGSRTPSIHVLPDLADALGVTIDYLLTGKQ